MRPLGWLSAPWRGNGAPDPAPSRTRYRFERLWLTPLFRVMLRVGVPVAAVLVFTSWYLGDAGRMAQLMEGVAEVRRSVEERPEFMVKLITVEGAAPELAQDISEALPIDLPISRFALDLEGVRQALEGLDPVKSAQVRIKPGGLLAIEVTERTPAVLWLSDDGLELLAADGHRVSAVSGDGPRPDLPLIAGPGANAQVPEALRLIAAAAPIRDQVRGLVRVGARRWNLVLTSGAVVMLPEADPGLALDRALALDAAQEVLSRDIVALDYRLALRPTIRMSDAAHAEWQRIKSIEVLSKEDRQ